MELLQTFFLLSFVVFIGSKESSCSKVVKSRKFPKNFYFGVSTAAYQIEGAWNVSDKGENIWDRLTHTDPNSVKNKDNGDVACDSYHKISRDVEMLQELGVHFYRFSISWSRLLPTGFPDSISKDGLNYYNKLINSLLLKGIAPMVTLYHWDLPQPLQDLGGWPNPLLAEYFEDYARVVFDAFGDRVKIWLTFNEPREFCRSGYADGGGAPMLKSPGMAEYMCSHTVLKAHANAYHLYRKQFAHQRGKLGITLDVYWNEPATLSNDDVEAAERAIQFNFGWFAHPILSRNGDFPEVMKKRIAARSYQQHFPRSRLPKFTSLEVQQIKGSVDFLGINHYSSRMTRKSNSTQVSMNPSFDDDCGVEEFFDQSWPGSASSWLKVVPWGFQKILNWIRKEYNNPVVFITENGFSTHGGLDDQDRVVYMNGYLNALLDAVDDGCQVVGYTAWSLMDNFEWLNGYTERFGLYEVDFESPKRTRTLRQSGKIYAKIIKSLSIASIEDCPDCDKYVDPLAYNAIIF